MRTNHKITVSDLDKMDKLLSAKMQNVEIAQLLGISVFSVRRYGAAINAAKNPDEPVTRYSGNNIVNFSIIDEWAKKHGYKSPVENMRCISCADSGDVGNIMGKSKPDVPSFPTPTTETEKFRIIANTFDHMGYSMHLLSKFILENFCREEVKPDDAGTKGN